MLVKAIQTHRENGVTPSLPAQLSVVVIVGVERSSTPTYWNNLFFYGLIGQPV